jgi:hypothetical protein
MMSNWLINVILHKHTKFVYLGTYISKEWLESKPVPNFVIMGISRTNPI